MSKIIAIANQKGGVGKTTTAVNLAAALVKEGYSVLCIDLDPQANMSDYLGYEGGESPTMSALLQKSVMVATPDALQDDVAAAIIENSEDIHYIPSDIILSSADVFIATAMKREELLKKILYTEAAQSYDYVLIDCLPSLGILLTNALATSDEIVIPVQAQKFGYDGLSQLQDAINMVRLQINPTLTVNGILLTMADNTNMSKMVHAALIEDYPELVYHTAIRRKVEATESTALQQSLVSNDKSDLGAEYIKVAKELTERSGK